MKYKYELPNDCIGVIIGFFNGNAFSLLIKLLLLSKSVKYYIENEFPFCASHLIFKSNKIKKKVKRKDYVFNLIYSGTEDVNSNFFEIFPNLKKLSIDINNKDEGCFSNKFKRKLKKVFCKKNESERNKFFLQIRKLKTLKIKNSYQFCDESFRYLPNVTTLSIDNCPLITDQGLPLIFATLRFLQVKNSENIFKDKTLLKNFIKLKILIVYNNQNFDDEVLENSLNIQIVVIDSCKNFTGSNLKGLNLKSITIKNDRTDY